MVGGELVVTSSPAKFSSAVRFYDETTAIIWVICVYSPAGPELLSGELPALPEHGGILFTRGDRGKKLRQVHFTSTANVTFLS